MQPATAATAVRRRPRPPPRPLPTPGPARLGAAVDVIVGHLRRLLLLRAWQKMMPTLTQGELALRLLERQRLRMEESSSCSDPTPRDPDDRRQRHTPGDSYLAEAASVGASLVDDARSRSRLPRPREGLGDEEDGAIGARSRSTSPAVIAAIGGSGSRLVRSADAGVVGRLGQVMRGGQGQKGQKAGEGRAKGKGGNGGVERLTIQACFKEEREAFIRDLQVLHRQLEAKDRDRARREREYQEATARARVEARSAQERVGLLRKEAEDALSAKGAAEAMAEAASNSLERQTAAVESLRARLRHTERQHKEQMDVTRRQQSAATEDATTERRRLESAALTARKALTDERREWSADKDTLLAAVREACHRADLASGEAEEAKANALSLEGRLQQTLERESTLNTTVDKEREAAREAERRVARAEGDLGRSWSTAAAQEQALLGRIKDLEARAARAERMQADEQARRSDLQAQLERERETALEAVAQAQREMSTANRRVVALGEAAAALRSEAEAGQQHARDAEVLAGMAGAASEKLEAQLKEASAENDQLAAAAAREKKMLQSQWLRREDAWRLALQRAQQQQQQPPSPQLQPQPDRENGGGEHDAREGTELEAVLTEVEKLQATAIGLSRDKEGLLRSLTVARQQLQEQHGQRQQQQQQQQRSRRRRRPSTPTHESSSSAWRAPAAVTTKDKLRKYTNDDSGGEIFDVSSDDARSCSVRDREDNTGVMPGEEGQCFGDGRDRSCSHSSYSRSGSRRISDHDVDGDDLDESNQGGGGGEGGGTTTATPRTMTMTPLLTPGSSPNSNHRSRRGGRRQPLGNVLASSGPQQQQYRQQQQQQGGGGEGRGSFTTRTPPGQNLAQRLASLPYSRTRTDSHCCCCDDSSGGLKPESVADYCHCGLQSAATLTASKTRTEAMRVARAPCTEGVNEEVVGNVREREGGAVEGAPAEPRMAEVLRGEGGTVGNDGDIDDSDDDDDHHDEEEEALAPRGGPAPVPSPLMTLRRSGGGGGEGGSVRPAETPVTAVALLRSTLGKERDQRLREHTTLLDLLRRIEERAGKQRRQGEHGGAETSTSSSINSSNSGGGGSGVSLNASSHEQTDLKPRKVDIRDPTCGDEDHQHQHQRQRHQQHCKKTPDSGVIEHGVEEHNNDAIHRPPVAAAAAAASMDAWQGGGPLPAPPLPLSSEAWRGVLAALERLLWDTKIAENSVPGRQGLRQSGHRDRRQQCSCFFGETTGGDDSSGGSEMMTIREGGQGGEDWSPSTDGGRRDATLPEGTPNQYDGSSGATSENNISSVLTSALRELLATTPSAPGAASGGGQEEDEEGSMRLGEASLPELITALRREWDSLLEGMEAMQEELQIVRDQVVATTYSSVNRVDAATTTSQEFQQHLDPQQQQQQCRQRFGRSVSSAAAVGASATAAAAAEAQGQAQAQAAAERRRAANLERALYCAEETRAAVESALREAEERLAASEGERSVATEQLASALQANAAERSSMEAERSAVSTERSAERSAAAAAAASSAAVTTALRRALEDRDRVAEKLRDAAEAADAARRQAEEMLRGCARDEMEKRRREVERAERAAKDKVAAAREEGRREAQLRVEALESALDRLAETGSAAEDLSKEQLEVTRELSTERDELYEENQRYNERLGELTSALREVREEKARLENQVFDRERGLEALRARADVERFKVARLQTEVEKAQVVCREMTDRLVELQEAQTELGNARDSLAKANQELEAFRKFRDELSAASEEACRTRGDLENARRATSEMSARAAEAEGRAEEASLRANQLEARAEALQHELDQVPKDLLVAHAEKRVLQGALDHAEASAEAEIRRRDADIRSFASAAALEQERYGKRLREQALTIHQLTLQGFSVEAQAAAAAASAAEAVSKAPPSYVGQASVRGGGVAGGWGPSGDWRWGSGASKQRGIASGTTARLPPPHMEDLYVEGKRRCRGRGKVDDDCRAHLSGAMKCDAATDDAAADGGGGGNGGGNGGGDGGSGRQGLGPPQHALDSGFPGPLPLLPPRPTVGVGAPEGGRYRRDVESGGCVGGRESQGGASRQSVGVRARPSWPDPGVKSSNRGGRSYRDSIGGREDQRRDR